MRIKRNAIYISIGVSIFTLLPAILFFALSNEGQSTSPKAFISSAFLGAFGSSFAVLLFSIIEYHQSKADSFRKLRLSVADILQKLCNDEYFDALDPRNIIIEAIREKENREITEKILKREIKENPELANNPYANNDLYYWQRQLANSIKERRQRSLSEGTKLLHSDEFYFDEAAYMIDRYTEKIVKIVNTYKQLGQTDTSPIINDLYDIGFFLDPFRSKKRKIKGRLYDGIVGAIEAEKDTIRNTSIFFTEYKKDDFYSHAIALDYIFKLQDQLFENEHKIINGQERLIIQRKTVNTVMNVMNQFIT